MLLEFEKWLRGINESAADSLLEAAAEILPLHRLKVPALLRKTLHIQQIRLKACFPRCGIVRAISNGTVEPVWHSDG